MGWVWTAVVVWVLLSVPAAVLLGRVIRRADEQELGAPIPDDVPHLPARPHSPSGT